jgi:xylulokinase
MLYIGIDSGTQSTKAVVLELGTGEIVAEAQRGYGLIEGLAPGHLEQHPREWVAAVEACVDECVDKLGVRRGEVRGLGVSGQQHGLVVLDGEGEVVRPAKLWCDTSTAAQCEQFAVEFGGVEGLVELAGNAILPGYTIPKLLWLKQEEPENFERVRLVLLPHDYLNHWLTGVARMEYGDASGTGVLDVRRREWCRPLMDFVDGRCIELFPEVGSSLDGHGILRGELASRWGFGEGVVVSAGGGDNMMGAIGTGNVVPGVVTASFGTSGTLYGAAATPVVDPGGEVAGFCDSADGWLPLVCTMNVTVVSEAVRALFGWGLGELEEALRASQPGAGGLSFLPYLNGERTPNLPGGSGVLHGVRVDNLRPENLVRSAVEGATLGLGYGMRRFVELGLERPREVRVTGGGSKSAAWRQIAADVFGAEVVALATSEGAALGAAIQAARTDLARSGVAPGYEELCGRLVALDESTRCAPDAGRVGLYEEALERQVGLTRGLAGSGWL